MATTRTERRRGFTTPQSNPDVERLRVELERKVAEHEQAIIVIRKALVHAGILTET